MMNITTSMTYKYSATEIVLQDTEIFIKFGKGCCLSQFLSELALHTDTGM